MFLFYRYCGFVNRLILNALSLFAIYQLMRLTAAVMLLLIINEIVPQESRVKFADIKYISIISISKTRCRLFSTGDNITCIMQCYNATGSNGQRLSHRGQTW